MPEPSFVKLLDPPVSVIVPPIVSVFALVVTVGLDASVTVPVPKFSELLPVNVKLPFHVCALFEVLLIDDPDVLLIVVPAAIVKVPLPNADALLIPSVPRLNKVPPL